LEVIDPAMTVKVTGHQWFWEYEYADFLNEENESINFDSYMKDESILEKGQLRMLEVDNPLLLPIDTHIRFVITAADVLHDWAMPSLSLKVDACPGRLNQASVIIERPALLFGQCSEICLRLGRSICSGKGKSSLIFPSTGFSVNYDVNLCELSLKYIQIGVLNLWILGAYVNYTNKNSKGLFYNDPKKILIKLINKIIVKLILFERSLTCNWDSSRNIPPKSSLLCFINIYKLDIFNNRWIEGLKTNDIFKQEGILISEGKKVFWLTEIKSAIIQSTNWSKLGNPVFRIFLRNPELKQNSSLQLYCKSWIKQFILGASRGQDRYQDNYIYLNGFLEYGRYKIPSYKYRGQSNNEKVRIYNRIWNLIIILINKINFSSWFWRFALCFIPWENQIINNYPNYRAYSVWNNSNRRLQNKDKFKYNESMPVFRTVFRQYSSVRIMKNIKPLKDKKLTKEVLQTFKEGNWMTVGLKQRLTTFIENVQKSISETTLTYGMYSKELNYLTESYLHSLLVQVHAIEVLSKNKGSKTPGSDSLILDNNCENKILILKKIKRFYSIEKIPGRRVYIPKPNSKELRPLTIPSIIDRVIQQLFLTVIDPIIEVNSDLYSFGFRKGRNQIMAIGHIQKKLQSKPSRGEITQVDYPLIWDADIRKCFDSINHEWLLNNIPIPKKYKFIFKKWLTSGFVEFGNDKIYPTYQGVPQGGLISPLLMNMTLNGMENLIEEAKLEYKNKIKKSVIRKRKDGSNQLSVKMKSKVKAKFKEINISCNLIRYADDFIIICGSPILLDILKRKVKEFLKIRGLEIHLNKSKTIYFKINAPFNFLGYTFVYLIRTNNIRSKFLMRYIREYRLEGRPRLYVYPSTLKYDNIKLKIKNILRSNYNTTIFQLISKLNPIIRGWVNYYSFSNSGGTLTSFRKFMYCRLKIYLIKKHKKASIRWLMKQYFLLNSLPEQYSLKPKLLLKVNPGILKNKWTFFGLAFKDSNGNFYDEPRINILLWPNKIKKLVTATLFAPSRELLKSNYYLNKELWNEEIAKLQKHHFSFKTTLWETLYTRDGNFCYLCKDTLIDDINDMNTDTHVHHIKPWSKDKTYDVDNLALVHANCHEGWHLEPLGKVEKTNKCPKFKGEIYSKNRTKIKFYKNEIAKKKVIKSKIKIT
jgi:RNA-directed DNA polymerase